MNSIIDHQRDQEIMKDPISEAKEKKVLKMLSEYQKYMDKVYNDYLVHLSNPNKSSHPEYDGIISLINKKTMKYSLLTYFKDNLGLIIIAILIPGLLGIYAYEKTYSTGTDNFIIWYFIAFLLICYSIMFPVDYFNSKKRFKKENV